MPACNTCSSTGSIRKDSIQTLHIMDTTHQTLLVKTGNEQSAWSHHPQLCIYTQFRCRHFLPSHYLHMWQNIHNIRLCLWHLFLTSLLYLLSCWLIVITISVFMSGFFISFTTSIIQSSTFRQWTLLCMITFSFSSHVASSPHVASSLPYVASSLLPFYFEFNFSLLFFLFRFCSLSYFCFSFSSSSCCFFKAFSSRNLSTS